MQTQGKLYVVATPIGHLKDMSFRAVDTLKAVDVIYAEDTRHSRVLMQHYQIQTPLRALHEHNERQKVAELLALLQQGQDLALISDAGTPLISDPGFPCVQALRKAGVDIVPVPGACALVAALSAAGLPTDRFRFEGFLPAKSAARLARLKALASADMTLIFYESTHRLLACLADMAACFGPAREMVLVKELTKQYETFYHGRFVDVIAWLKEDPLRQKGEFVLLIQGQIQADLAEKSDIILKEQQLLQVLLAYCPLKQAAQIAAELTGRKKNALYQQLLEYRDER